ncbi:uncharacterized protein [Triticum aestivum]|uniref:uncharacterized protein n=1 Tax=Triticum aestivum TaxID=4565 RepID=UPI001D00D4E9|nr:uncharacterized protein LOC123039549 [Triticum aestivum]
MERGSGKEIDWESWAIKDRMKEMEDFYQDTEAAESRSAENLYPDTEGSSAESESESEVTGDDDCGDDDEEIGSDDDDEEIPSEICNLTKYLRFCSHYENKLALIENEDEDEDKDEDEDEDENGDEDEDENEDISALEYLKKEIADEQESFGEVYDCWERVWGSKIGGCGGLEDTTTLSPMFFTHSSPRAVPSPAAIAGRTLLIYSIRILEKKGKTLKWPLKVYGVIVARDTVDRNRNILFSRSRCNYQKLDKQDSSLCLTGPSRAIFAVDTVDFEVELKINEGAEEDTTLISSCNHLYDSVYDLNVPQLRSATVDSMSSILICGCWCDAELTFEKFDTAVQATIVGVHVVEGGWPFKCGCRVACSWSSATRNIGPTSREVVLLDYRGENMDVGSNGYLHLSRNVVPVELQGTLRLVIEAYPEAGCKPVEGHVDFGVQHCQTSNLSCEVDNSTVEVTVAWSPLVKEKLDLLVEGYAAGRD